MGDFDKEDWDENYNDYVHNEVDYYDCNHSSYQFTWRNPYGQTLSGVLLA
uniref:Uncharacterized protein n=1 Tax=Moniliophthora roreri TaxID=221103 RepID=A0A0W0G0D8_MONRR